MAEEVEAGCARPTGGPVGEPVEESEKAESQPIKKEMQQMVHVGERRIL